MAMTLGAGSAIMGGTSQLEQVTTSASAEETGLLGKLGGFLTKGKEKLQVVGRVLKQNPSLIYVPASYIFFVGAAAAMQLYAIAHSGTKATLSVSSVGAIVGAMALPGYVACVYMGNKLIFGRSENGRA
jgi:hypothetical protein